MHRRPDETDLAYETTPNAFVGARRRSADQSAHAIEPFFSAGGQPYWITDASESFFPDQHGVQLLATVYVPKGRMGFLKELRVAPYCPSPLCDPWTSSGVSNYLASWRWWNRSDPGNEGPLPQMGDLWRMPMGWEAAWDSQSAQLPLWTWSLRFLQGDVSKLRNQGQLNIPPFSTAIPASWYLAPNVPVPATAYPAGLPGAAVGPQWDSQRLQILPTDKTQVHVPIPQDTTLCLFAQWSQDSVAPYGFNHNGPVAYAAANIEGEGRVPPIGPSMGSLLGYMQALNADATKENLELGWGG